MGKLSRFLGELPSSSDVRYYGDLGERTLGIDHGAFGVRSAAHEHIGYKVAHE